MALRRVLFFLGSIFLVYVLSIAGSGCAQIGSPTGGPKDTIAPELVSAYPPLYSTNFKGNRISFVFNEYIEVKDAQTNVLMSPYPKSNPVVNWKLKNVTVKIKDTLKPNTTYAIDFGNAIVDNNESNPYKNFVYVFSTGNTIDSAKFRGKVILAETGKTDSTVVAILYKDAVDSTVKKRKPDYLAKLNGKGEFMFRNVAPGRYNLYALRDGDGSKSYNSLIEGFAFMDSSLQVVGSDSLPPVVLYAYEHEKDKRPGSSSASSKAIPEKVDKKLKFTNNLGTGQQDLLSDLVITFNHPLKTFEPQKLVLTDSNKVKQTTSISIDSTRKIVTLKNKWQPEMPYHLILDKESIVDSTDGQLNKTDTLSFVAKKESDYGNVLIRFTDVDTSLHPVLQFVQQDNLVKSVPITSNQWNQKLFTPGEYIVRILYDTNGNGVWDTGNYDEKIQPEKAVLLDYKIQVKANWDNEKDIKLLKPAR